jgi:hypothetical protein
MTKKFPIVGLVVAAAASSAIAFGAPSVKAACATAGPGTIQNCTTFDSSATTTTLIGFALTDGGFINGTGIQRIQFSANQAITLGTSDWNFTPDPITISNIEYSFGWTGTEGTTTWTSAGLNTTSVTLGSGQVSSFNAITGTSSAGNIPAPSGQFGSEVGSAFAVRFQVPVTTTSNNGQLALRVQAVGGGEQSQTRVFNATTQQSTSSEVPGPLPLLGAGAAFGFSRSMRRRIAQSV